MVRAGCAPRTRQCAAAPVYCGTADEVGACVGKVDRDPCSTALVPRRPVPWRCSAPRARNDIAGCRNVGWNADGPRRSRRAICSSDRHSRGFGEAYAVGVADGTSCCDTTRSQWLERRFDDFPRPAVQDLAEVVVNRDVTNLRTDRDRWPGVRTSRSGDLDGVVCRRGSRCRDVQRDVGSTIRVTCFVVGTGGKVRAPRWTRSNWLPGT